MRKSRQGAVQVIAVAGGSGSGKTTFARKLVAALEAVLGPGHVTILSQDSYYLDQSARFDGDGGSVNFDHPEALDFPLLATHLEVLRRGVGVDVPVYEFASHKRLGRTERLEPGSIVLLDGTLVLGQGGILACLDHGVFLDVPEAVRFERRLRRDVSERGREPEGVRRQFERQVAPMHDQFVQPTLASATRVIRHGDDLAAHVAALVESLLKGAR